MNALDYGLYSFSSKLEMCNFVSASSTVNDALKSMCDDNNDNARLQSMGWALPKRRKSARFPPSVKKFLKKIYDDGERYNFNSFK